MSDISEEFKKYLLFENIKMVLSTASPTESLASCYQENDTDMSEAKKAARKIQRSLADLKMADVIKGLLKLVTLVERVPVARLCLFIINNVLNDEDTRITENCLKAIRICDDRILKERAAGVCKEMAASSKLLNIDPETLNGTEATVYVNKIAYECLQFIGELESKIRALSVSENSKEVKNVSMYVETYSAVILLRIFHLSKLLVILRAVRGCDILAKNVKEIRTDNLNVTKKCLEFLSAPKQSNAFFLFSFDISKCPSTKMCFKLLDLNFPDLSKLTSAAVTLSPDEWQGVFMSMSWIPLHWLVSSRNAREKKCKFMFEAVPGFSDTFRIRSCLLKTRYVVMTVFFKFCRCWEGDTTDDQGEWKVVKFADGKFMLSPRKWPYSFLHMKDMATGSVSGKNGKLSRQNVWIINYVNDN